VWFLLYCTVLVPTEHFVHTVSPLIYRTVCCTVLVRKIDLSRAVVSRLFNPNKQDSTNANGIRYEYEYEYEYEYSYADSDTGS